MRKFGHQHKHLYDHIKRRAACGAKVELKRTTYRAKNVTCERCLKTTAYFWVGPHSPF
jgi:NMD protein affecting ribosome stability and mRNA decay